MSALVSVLCLAVGVLLLGILLCWRILVIGGQEPDYNAKRKAWFQK